LKVWTYNFKLTLPILSDISIKFKTLFDNAKIMTNEYRS
jgi:hypothetical protein